MKQPGNDDDHSFLTATDVINALSCTSMPPYIFITCCLINQAHVLIHLFISSFEGKRPLRGRWHAWQQSNIHTALEVLKWLGAGRIHLVQAIVQWRATVNSIPNVRVPRGLAISWGHAVAWSVKVLCYKPGGRGFYSLCHWIFRPT
jgi:hypothetical protein